ncbi:MAG: hypothetical protein ABEI74_00025 [Candidatus Pacearchaeota archaeon]
MENSYEEVSEGAKFGEQEKSRLAERLIKKNQSERSLLDEARFLSRGIHQEGIYRMSLNYEESVSREMDEEAKYIFDEIVSTYKTK